MKVKYLFLVLSWITLSCTNKKQEASNAQVQDTTSKDVTFKVVKVDARKIGPEKPSEQVQIEEAINKIEINKDIPVVGYWVGMFGKNKINIALADMKEGKAIGYTVCAGNFRPIEGTASMGGDSVFIFDMKEPGTDQYDGHFNFTINVSQNKLIGTWAPFKVGVVAPKQFALVKTTYAYSPENGEYPQASERLLTAEDVSNMLKEELQLMRNEIYARHGYSFKDKEIRHHFDSIAWYIPMGVDVRQELTDEEVQNIDLIYEYENYYEEEYDDYGR
jgi:hypothetical protein